MKVSTFFDLQRGNHFSISLSLTDESNQETIEQDTHQGLSHCFHLQFHEKKHIIRAVALVTVFAVLFNGSRWFEVTLEKVPHNQLFG